MTAVTRELTPYNGGNPRHEYGSNILVLPYKVTGIVDVVRVGKGRLSYSQSH
jgi:hypothetical protein